MHVFYTPDISSDQYILNEQESKHCIQVLRLTAGAKVILVDGKGGYFEAVIASVSKKQVALKVMSAAREYGMRKFNLHIAVAPTKNMERLEWFLEKATELGISQVTPVICDRSERKIVNEERLNRVITSAVKQSMQAYHPVLNPAVSFKDLLMDRHPPDRFIAHCADSEKETLQKLLDPERDCIVLIGPEGDFSSAEIELALQNGFKPITLGKNRLRTETAALAACFEVNYLNR